MIDFEKRFLAVVFSIGFLMVIGACEQKKVPPEPVIQDVVTMAIPQRPEPKGSDEKGAFKVDTVATSQGGVSIAEGDGAARNPGSNMPQTKAPTEIEPKSEPEVVDFGDGLAPSGAVPSQETEIDLTDTAFQGLIQLEEAKIYYSGEGKIDPFDPLIKETPPPEKTVEVEEEVPKRILTPLEKLDFSQMKLVAVIGREGGNIAMVQETGGKGYLVDIGTYIGKNSGQVIKIEKDKVIVQEQVKDFKGNIMERFQEMKLNKLVEDKG